MEAYARAKRNGKPADLQANVNTVLGELWKIPGEKLDASEIDGCRVEDIPAEEVQMVTAGVDVQQDSLYYVVRGWGFLSTSWLLDCGRIMGAPEHPEVWSRLANVLSDTFCERAIRMALVDSGHETAMVYQQCRKHGSWHPARGRDVMSSPYKDSLVDESVTGRPLKTLRLWLHCVDTWQQWLNARIRWTFGEPGAWYIPAQIDQIAPDYAHQVTNQTCTIARGKRNWSATGDRNDHYRDCELLAAIAADIQGVRRLRPAKTAEEKEQARMETTVHRTRGKPQSLIRRPAL